MKLQLSKLCGFIFLLLSVNAYANDIKVGYVQVDKILQEAPQTAETSKKLEKEFSPRTQELDRLQKQIKDALSPQHNRAQTTSQAGIGF